MMKLPYFVIACLIGIFTSTAKAQTADKLLISAGWLHFAPHHSSNPFAITCISGIPKYAVLENTGAFLRESEGLGVSATYFFNTHLAAEFALHIGPEWDLHTAGALRDYKKIGVVRSWTPMLLLKYYFFEDTARLRPYIGFGGSLTRFTNARITNDHFNELFDGETSSLSLSHAWNPVFNAGFLYRLKKQWFVGAALSYIPTHTTVTLTTPTSPYSQWYGAVITTQAKIRPQPLTTYLHIGHRF